MKALLICNPNNPLGRWKMGHPPIAFAPVILILTHDLAGRCYTRDGLVEIMKFCESKSIHLISDEIYALSVYQRPDRRSDSFVSALSIDPAGLIDHARVHILYGLSKVLRGRDQPLSRILTYPIGLRGGWPSPRVAHFLQRSLHERSAWRGVPFLLSVNFLNAYCNQVSRGPRLCPSFP